MTTPTHDIIAVSAYLAWEAEGRPHGRHEIHWLTAEAALQCAAAPVAVMKASSEASASPKAPAVRKTPAKKPAVAKTKAPRAAPETVVAAAALATPRAVRSRAKSTPSTH